MNKEKVRELIIGIRGFYTSEDAMGMALKWLEQNQSEPVVVGLSDEQVYSLYDYLANAENGFVVAYKEWAKTQTFAQQYKTDGFAEMQLDEAGIEYRELQSRYDQLGGDFIALNGEYVKARNELEQLKSQQFDVNWDDAPAGANFAALEFGWYKARPNNVLRVVEIFERPKTTPQVEVGQVWEALNMKFTVNQYVLGGRDSEVICVSDNGFEYKGTLADFLAKFVYVSL